MVLFTVLFCTAEFSVRCRFRCSRNTKQNRQPPTCLLQLLLQSSCMPATLPQCCRSATAMQAFQHGKCSVNATNSMSIYVVYCIAKSLPNANTLHSATLPTLPAACRQLCRQQSINSLLPAAGSSPLVLRSVMFSVLRAPCARQLLPSTSRGSRIDHESKGLFHHPPTLQYGSLRSTYSVHSLNIKSVDITPYCTVHWSD